VEHFILSWRKLKLAAEASSSLTCLDSAIFKVADLFEGAPLGKYRNASEQLRIHVKSEERCERSSAEVWWQALQTGRAKLLTSLKATKCSAKLFS
jgi:hypothetical protein